MWAVSIFSLWAAAILAPPAGCPSGQAIADELDRLGALDALAASGSAEVAIEGPTMRVRFLGRDETLGGTREAPAPASCQERAQLAAVVIAAWVRPLLVSPAGSRPTEARSPGSAASLRPLKDEAPGSKRIAPGLAASESPRSPSPPEPSSSSASPAPTREPPPRARAPVARPGYGLRPLWEIAGWVLGTHDGDAGALGGGLSVSRRFAARAAVATLFEAVRERETGVGPARAVYGTYRLGLGAMVVHAREGMFLDGGLYPELTLLTVRGRNLTASNTVVTWGAALDARVRLGWFVGPIAPFVFLGGSGALLAQHLTLDDAPPSKTLSRWAVNAGLGIAYGPRE